MRLLGGRLAAVALAAAMAACSNGGNSGGTDDTASTTGSTADTTTSSTTETTGQPATREGRVAEVEGDSPKIDNQRAASGDPIFAQGRLSTGGDGVIMFSVRDKLPDCQLLQDSAVQVTPQPQLLLAFQRGTTVCRTQAGAQDSILLGAGNTMIDMRDPAFSVVVGGPAEVDVRVARGFVQVRSGPGRRLLGPNQQTAVAGGGMPGAATTFDGDVPDRERRELGRLKGGPPDYSFPRSGSSPALANSRQSGRGLRVAFDDEAGGGDRRDFTYGFFEFLAGKWKIDLGDRPELTAEEGAAALAAGEIEVFVSDRSVDGTKSIPFFHEMWRINVAGGDARFASALTDFLLRALDYGDYGDVYRQAFGRIPNYDRLRSLVFPP